MLKTKFYTTQEVAQMLQLHHLTVLKYINNGNLKALKFGRVYRIKESDLEAFIEKSST